MTKGIDQSLVAKAQELGPLIREHAAEAEKHRRLSQPVIDALDKAGFTRLYLPKSLGGLETDPLTALRIGEELARHDAAATWLLMARNSAAFTLARLPDATVETMGAAPQSGAVNPPGVAREVEGGYKVTARLPFVSGCLSAKYVMLTAFIFDGDKPRMINGIPAGIMVFMPTSDTQIIDTWHSLGMRGTDSNDVAIQDLFIPTAWTCPMAPEFQPNKHCKGPLYRLPAYTCIVGWISIAALGVARAAIDEVKNLAAARVPMGANMAPIKDRGASQEKLGKAETMWRAARAYQYEAVAEAWEVAQAGEVPLPIKANLMAAMTNTSQTSAEIVNLIWPLAGSSAVYERSPMPKLLRDISVIRQHAFTCPGRYETLAQVMLGLPPDFPLLFI